MENNAQIPTAGKMWLFLLGDRKDLSFSYLTHLWLSNTNIHNPEYWLYGRHLGKKLQSWAQTFPSHKLQDLNFFFRMDKILPYINVSSLNPGHLHQHIEIVCSLLRGPFDQTNNMKYIQETLWLMHPAFQISFWFVKPRVPLPFI